MTGRRFRQLVLACAVVATSLAAPVSAAPPTTEAVRLDARGYIVVFRPNVTTPLTLTRSLEQARGFVATRSFRLIKGFAARLTPAQLAAVRADPRVAFVDEDRVFRAADAEALVAGEAVPTGVKRIGAVESGYVRGASGVNVAVLDTGIDLVHRDLNVVHGKNCLGSVKAYDDRGHGTAVAGTIAARNNGMGMVGVAPGTRVVSVKVLDKEFEGTTASLVCGIEWVTSTLTDADPTNDILVANMSLYGRASPVQDCAVTQDVLHRAICASTAAGVTYVVSAGNTGGPFDHPHRQAVVPAAYPEVLAVTAMADSDGKPGGLGAAPKCKPNEVDDRFASFSSFAYTEVGQSHTIAAPGVCIKVILPGGGYFKVGFGTSQTAPQVAGAVALCINNRGTPGPCAGLTPAEVIQKVRANAAAWTTAHPSSGFAGDPSRPVAGRYYGHLVRVGVDRPVGVEATPPSGVSIKKGVLVGGSNASLGVDDGNHFSVGSTARATKTTVWIGRFKGVPRNAVSMALSYSGLASVQCTQVIALRNFAKRTWVNLDSRALTPAEQLIELAVAGAPSAFVSGTGATGEVWARVRCATSTARFYSAVDFLQLEYARP